MDRVVVPLRPGAGALLRVAFDFGIADLGDLGLEHLEVVLGWGQQIEEDSGLLGLGKSVSLPAGQAG